MDAFLTSVGAALWLGILTSISPCPLATNIAAISYVGRNAGQSRLVLASAGLYTLGRVVAYSVLGALVVASLLSAPGLSVWLQKYLNLFLGPFLIVVGMILLELLELPAGTFPGQRIRHGVRRPPSDAVKYEPSKIPGVPRQRGMSSGPLSPTKTTIVLFLMPVLSIKSRISPKS